MKYIVRKSWKFWTNQKYYFVGVSMANGKTITRSSEMYTNHDDCYDAATLAASGPFEVVDETKSAL
jgi:uncharacterized protein YegP (UPF0339 family)